MKKTFIALLSFVFLSTSPFASGQEAVPSPEERPGLRSEEPTVRDEPIVSVPSESTRTYPKPGTPLNTPVKSEPTAAPTAAPKPAASPKAAASPKPAASPSSPRPAASPAAKRNVAASVREMENKWGAAISSRDTAAVETLLADNYMGVTSTGRIVNKAGVLAQIKNDKNTYASVTNTRLDVRAHGDAAVAVGATRQKGKTPEGQAFDYTYRWTDTWVERGDGKWQCVASQSILVPK